MSWHNLIPLVTAALPQSQGQTWSWATHPCLSSPSPWYADKSAVQIKEPWLEALANFPGVNTATTFNSKSPIVEPLGGRILEYLMRPWCHPTGISTTNCLSSSTLLLECHLLGETFSSHLTLYSYPPSLLYFLFGTSHNIYISYI